MEESKSGAKMSRLKEKLLGRTKDHTSDANKNVDDISSFLHGNGSSDQLQMTGIPPPKLQRIDTSTANRWPSAADINNRMRVASESKKTRLRRNTKDLIVRFTDQAPEVIGFGGDEEEAPTMHVSSNKAMNRKKKEGENMVMNGRSPSQSLPYPCEANMGNEKMVQVRVEEISGKLHELSLPGREDIIQAATRDDFSPSGYLKVEPPDPSSATAKIQAGMRAAEGLSLRNSVLMSNVSPTSETGDEIPDPSTPSSASSTHVVMPQPTRISPVTSLQQADLRSINFAASGDSRNAIQTNGTFQTSPISPSMRSDASLSPQHLQKAPTWTLRDAALAVKDDALEDFRSRVENMFSLFSISAESRIQLSSVPLELLLMTASWWFLRGRSTLEATIRERNPKQQAYADLAKCLWLVKLIVPANTEFRQINSQVSRDEKANDQLNTHQMILTGLNKLMMSMKRNELLPPPPGEGPLPQGLDTSIWIQYPDFTPDIVSLLSNNGKGSLVANSSQSPILISEIIPLGDTRQTFNLGRMFVDGFLMEEGIESQQFRCPCILSMCRGQKDTQITLTIASQNGLIKLCVQLDKSRGLTWKDVQWRPRSNAIELKLSRGFIFKVQCTPQDFANLYGLYDSTNKKLSSMDPCNDENVLFETRLLTFQFFDQNPQSRVFPREPVSHCRVRLFEKRLAKAEGTARSFHRGFRLVVLTSTRTKTLSCINAEIQGLILYGFMRGEGGVPALMIKIQNKGLQGLMALNFNEVHERAQLHNLLIASSKDESEGCFADCKLTGFAINQPNTTPSEALSRLQWQSATVLNEGDVDAGVESTRTVLSEQLRVVMYFQNGSLTDRINVGKGELKLRLNAQEDRNELQLLRRSQEDMSIAISDSHFPNQLPGELAELLKVIVEPAYTIRIYKFPSLIDLHRFQAAITGYNILFDGTAVSFAISRRRMVVPIYKKWDATTTRLQIIRRDKITQLVAFFSNFSHGDCMNFTLKGTDNFETSSKNGKFLLKIVDAKFALPRGGDERGADTGVEKNFICLDMPEYPTEHDDITITFDTEAEFEKFTQALPAPTKTASRMGSIRR